MTKSFCDICNIECPPYFSRTLKGGDDWKAARPNRDMRIEIRVESFPDCSRIDLCPSCLTRQLQQLIVVLSPPVPPTQ